MPRLLALLVLACPTLAFAHSSGAAVAGAACANCHHDGTDSNVTLMGPASIAPGATVQYSVIVKSSTATVAGIDVSTSAGTLGASGSDVSLVSGQIVHTSPASITAGEATFDFSVTAPQSGTITLKAKGVAGTGGGDGQAATASTTITVSSSGNNGGGSPMDMGSGSTIPPGTGPGGTPSGGNPGNGGSGTGGGGPSNVPPSMGGCSVANTASQPLVALLLVGIAVGLLARARRRAV
jgi:MYXO-CTERM domain-containing protein